MFSGLVLFVIALWYVISMQAVIRSNRQVVSMIYLSESRFGNGGRNINPDLIKELEAARRKMGKVVDFRLGPSGVDLGLSVTHTQVSVLRGKGWYSETILGYPQPRQLNVAPEPPGMNSQR